MKQLRIYTTLLCALLLAASCSKETEMETETTNPPADVTSLVKIGSFPAFDDAAGTRAGTPDPGKTTWTDGDKVMLKLTFPNTKASHHYTFTYDGTKWESDNPLTQFLPHYRANITAYYAPAYEWGATSTETGIPSLTNGKKAGTDEYLVYSEANAMPSQGININFSGTRPYSRLRIATEPGANVLFTPDNATFTPAGSPSSLTNEETLTATADANGNAFFYGQWTPSAKFNFFMTNASKMLVIEKNIPQSSEAAKSYAIDATQLLEPFSITIDTRKSNYRPQDNEPGYKNFILPFSNVATKDYQLQVSWGDGKSTLYPAGTTLDIENLTHLYSTPGEYTIWIASTQTNPGNEQMPHFNFYQNYQGEDYNSRKLISVNTPLLNMGATSLDECFLSCSSLTTIPAGLFDKSTQVTSFTRTFLSCTSLTTIPAGLFDNSTQATSFEACFSNCTSLTAIPAQLFTNNTQATNFKECFINCQKAVLNSDIFCHEATQKSTRFQGKQMNFEGCFSSCGFSLTTNAGGIAPTLWNYTLADVAYTSCFFNATRVTNRADIPTAWARQ